MLECLILVLYEVVHNIITERLNERALASHQQQYETPRVDRKVTHTSPTISSITNPGVVGLNGGVGHRRCLAKAGHGREVRCRVDAGIASLGLIRETDTRRRVVSPRSNTGHDSGVVGLNGGDGHSRCLDKAGFGREELC